MAWHWKPAICSQIGTAILPRFLLRSEPAPRRSWKWIVACRIGLASLRRNINRYIRARTGTYWDGSKYSGERREDWDLVHQTLSANIGHPLVLRHGFQHSQSRSCFIFFNVNKPARQRTSEMLKAKPQRKLCSQGMSPLARNCVNSISLSLNGTQGPIQKSNHVRRNYFSIIFHWTLIAQGPDSAARPDYFETMHSIFEV